MPNRISHNARCTVIIVNTAQAGEPAPNTARIASPGDLPAPTEPRLAARSAQIASIMAKHGLKELFGRPDEEGATGRRRQAKRLRAALEELGPTFSKLGQILSTRPDLLPPEYIEELAALQDRVPPMAEREVVEVMEQELGVPWEDVFGSIDPNPLAAGTIGQVHRATLVGGDRVVVKVQRPTARGAIEQDLALLQAFAERVRARPAFQKVIDLEAVFNQLSESLHRELDFGQEASNIERMRDVLAGYDWLGAPAVHKDLSAARFLVMEEIQGIPIARAPEGPERTEAARQLLESFYKQIIADGFFHADPHPGNLMWWKDKIYFLDLGMVGTLDADLREQLMLLLMAFWKEDAGFLTDVALMLSGRFDSSQLDMTRFQAEIGEISNRGARRDAGWTDSARDERDCAAARRALAGFPHPHRQGARSGSVGDRATRSDPRPFRGRRDVPDAILAPGHEVEDRSEDASLRIAEAEDAGPAYARGARTWCLISYRDRTGLEASSQSNIRFQASRIFAGLDNRCPSPQ